MEINNAKFAVIIETVSIGSPCNALKLFANGWANTTQCCVRTETASARRSHNKNRYKLPPAEIAWGGSGKVM